MKISKFTKNDSGFTCVCCGNKVKPLGYTSRDHCPVCLSSLHVDINPGDRQNKCEGILVPVEITLSNKKGYIIRYQCNKCDGYHNNKAAIDDDFETILSVMNKTYDKRMAEIKKTLEKKRIKMPACKCKNVYTLPTLCHIETTYKCNQNCVLL